MLPEMIDRNFMRGFVNLYAFWRASGGTVYGLEIMQEIRELGFTLNPGTFYPTLRALLKEGDATISSRMVKGEIRKCYRGTPKGRRELAEVRERLAVQMRKIF